MRRECEGENKWKHLIWLLVLSLDSLYFFYPFSGSLANKGIARIYGLFRYSGFYVTSRIFTYCHVSLLRKVVQMVVNSAVISGCKPLHFLAGRSISSVCIIVQSHIDAVMPHDILQCFRIHSGACHFRAESVP